jgi:fibronectin-binding autotransporter adhesin
MAFRSAGSGVTGTGTSAAVPVPSGVAAFDIIVVGIYIESADATLTPPAGFTLKHDTGTANAALRGRLLTFWKRATAGDTGTYSFTWTTSALYEAVAFAHSGLVRAGDPFEASAIGVSTNASGTTINETAITTETAAADIVSFATNHATNAGAYTAPSGMTGRYDNSGSGTAHLGGATQDALGPTASFQKTYTLSGTTGNSYPRGWIGALYGDRVVRRSTATLAPAAVTAQSVTLPAHESGDRIFVVVQGKFDTTTIPTIDQGFTLIKSGTGGVGTAATDTGPTFTAVYAKDATSSSESNPTVTPGGTAPNSWTISTLAYTPAEGLVFTDTIGSNVSWAEVLSDADTLGFLVGTTASFTGGQPTAGDLILAVGGVPSDAGTVYAASTTMTATGLSDGGRTGTYVENALNNDFAQVAVDWFGFSGTASSGITASLGITTLANHSGSIAVILVRQGVGGSSSYAAAGTVAGVSAVSSSAEGLKAVASGTVAGASSTAGATTSRLVGSGTVAGTSAVTGAATSRLVASGTVAATSAVTGAATIVSGATSYPASGTVAATSATSGTTGLRAVASGVVAAISGTVGDVLARLTASGVVEAISGVFGAASVPQVTVDTPDERTLVVARENRTLVIGSEARVLTAAPEDRTLVVTGETRNLGAVL